VNKHILPTSARAWLSSFEWKRTFLFEDQRSLPGPLLKMASINQSPEVKSILKQIDNLTTALSNDPLGVSGKLLSKDLICEDTHSKMLIDSYIPSKKAAILVEAVRNTIKIAPDKFQVFLEILSEQECAKEVVERLRSTYQSELTSLAYDQACQSRWEGLVVKLESQNLCVIIDHNIDYVNGIGNRSR
jgi:hypothetical protein